MRNDETHVLIYSKWLVMGLIVNPTQDRRVWRMTWLSYTQQLYNNSNLDKNTAENKQNAFT